MRTRPPPPSGRPPMYAVAGRAFGQTNLRPVVIGACIAAIVWSLICMACCCLGFTLIFIFSTPDTKKLVTFDIVIGSLYSAVAAIEFFGLFAAITRRTSLARLFAGLSLGVILLVGAAELVRTVVHFTHKSAILDQCQLNSEGFTSRTLLRLTLTGHVLLGWSSGDFLTRGEANDFCRSIYNRMSFSTIAWLILPTLFALFFASVAYSFYRQLLDPNSFRAPRAPSDQVRLEALRTQQQPYGGGYMPYPGFNSVPNYGPPPGPPPPQAMGGYNVPPYEDGQLPGYASEFPAKDVGEEKDADQKGGDPFMDAQHAGLRGAGPSETDLTHRI
ncbi:hypothetical protein JB92DRAFT_2954257 [Gautieria morchelliformis]|nr:hypothetical protein JB92DRAFT_2954257 [Gautieria morchelliformis]